MFFSEKNDPNICKNILARLFSVHNVISLSRHDQITPNYTNYTNFKLHLNYIAFSNQ